MADSTGVMSEDPTRQHLPRVPALSGVLETLAFFRDPDFAAKRFAAHGDLFETQLLGQRTVFVRGEAAIADLLRQSEALEGWWPPTVRELLGPLSLANRSGEAHRARRRIVGQLFTTPALRLYSPAIVQLVEELVRDLRTHPADRPLAPLMRRFAFQVIASTVLGLGSMDQDALFHDFDIWSRGLFSLPLGWPGTPLARAREARRRLLRRLGQVMQHAQAAAAGEGQSAAGGLAFLSDALDEAGLPLGDDDVVEQLLLLLFAGYETTASALSCLLLSLLQHPDTADWLQEELDTLPWPPPADQAVSAYDPTRAPRLDAVVKEVMRLTPPVGGFFRRTRQAVVVAGVEIPADRVVQVSLAATHRHGRPEDQLEEFRPQRHLEEGCSALVLPFGAGERVCLGRGLAELEIRLLAVGLLKNLRLRLVDGQDLSLMVVPSPTPRDGLRVSVAPLLAGALLLMGAASPSQDCYAVRDRRDAQVREAMQAEIVLLHGVRQRLCPRQEQLASEANALQEGQESEAGEAALDYDLYIRCREQAEQELQRTRPVLYRTPRGLPFYTPDGARLARQADALEQEVDRACPERLRR